MNKKRTLKERILLMLLLASLSVLAVLLIGYVFVKGLSGTETQVASIKEEGDSSDSDLEEEETVTEEEGETTELLDANTGVIYIGDSRFVGMNEACRISDFNREFVVAQVGQGFYWLENDAITAAEYIESTNTSFSHWKYVICLGINDLVNIEEYMTRYSTLIKEKDVTLVSVGPVGTYPDLSNEKVEAFNERLKTLDTDYIDYYTILVTEGYKTPDGLHYDDDTYRKIYDIITGHLGIVH
ncbi:MAG: SGNH/GDSL hydrolase family protein [Lachnospiraceae bacterium]|nr:SGNH/GDSL hydrolase family protein [Lachnospiraceae bacterium]